MTAEIVENKTGTFESTQVVANSPVSGGKWQVLDSRPVGIYRGVDDMVQVPRDAILELVTNALNGQEIYQKSQKQVNQLAEKIAKWVLKQQTRVAGFVGAWRIQESNRADNFPTIKAIFVFAQSDKDEINEKLWLDIARLDVQIAKLSDFANFQVSLIPVPFMTHEQLRTYLQIQCRD